MAPRKPPPPSAKNKDKDAEETKEELEVALLESETHKIHPNFRLFLVTTAGSCTSLPGMALYKGFHIIICWGALHL